MRIAVKLLGLAFAMSCGNALAADQPAAAAMSPPSAQGVATTGADNTSVNVRDKGGATQTPQKQTNAESDRKLLAAVRRAVVDDKTLSTYAHNVKITANGGVVTLRGPVGSDSEKTTVEKRAMQVAGVAGVDNQLDVKIK